MSSRKLWEENLLDDANERSLEDMIQERELFETSSMEDARTYAKLIGRGAQRLKNANYKE